MRTVPTHVAAAAAFSPSPPTPPTPLSALASWLSDEERERGRIALSALERRALGALPDGASLGGPEFEALFTSLGLEPLLEELGLPPPPSPEVLLRTITSGMMANPILVRLASEVARRPELCPSIPDKELLDHLRYAYLLDVLVRSAADDPVGPQPRISQLSRLLVDKRGEVRWRPHTNLFERLKVATIDHPIRGRIAAKRGRPIDPLGGVRSDRIITVNILEAMFEDVRRGLVDNAEAGFELIVEAAGLAPFEPALGNAPNGSWRPAGEEVGIKTSSPPLPTAWCELYQSWNLAFCSEYRDAGSFFCKLLTPAVALQAHGDPSAYMFHRVVALYVHIHREIFLRAERGSRLPPVDRRNQGLTRRWGELNRSAAAAYRAAVDERSSVERREVRASRRRSRRRIWAVVRAGARLAR